MTAVETPSDTNSPSISKTGLCPRVLIIAESASAKFGGEAAIPLHLFRVMRGRGYPVHMIVHERTRLELENLFPADRDHIHFVPDTKWHIRLDRLSHFLPHRLGYFTTGLLMRVLTQRAALQIARELIDQQRIEIVHQPTPVSPKEWSGVRRLGVPVVMGPMNGGMAFPPAFRDRESRLESIAIPVGRLFANIMNRLLPGKLEAATVLVANERTRESLPKGIAGNVELLPENGVDLAVWNFDSPTSADRRSAPCKFAFVGRLVGWKAVDLLLYAFAKVRAQGCDAVLQIIGDGEEQMRLEALASKLEISPVVCFAGWKSQRECAEILKKSDVFILPSLCECGGAVVLEAMSVGLPVIATNWGGPQDYIDPSCGVLIDPSNQADFLDGLANAMRRLADDPERRRLMGIAGQKKIRKLFDWERKVDRMVTIYQETIVRCG